MNKGIIVAILVLTAGLAVAFVIMGHDDFAAACVGAFISFGTHLINLIQTAIEVAQKKE